MSRYRIPATSCTIDDVTRELHSNSTLVTLSPKVFDCLAYLIAHNDRAIGRDELIAAVWGKGDVSDDLLGQIVVKARRAVGDTGTDQLLIRTIPRFGYRWVGEVEPLPNDAPVTAQTSATTEKADVPAPRADAPTDAVPAMRPRRWGRAWVIGIPVLAMIVIAGAIWAYDRYRIQQLPTPAAISPNSAPLMAVLPVEVSADREWVWLRLGMMDRIGEQLRSAGLQVVPASSIIALSRDNDADLAVITRTATGAQYIVTPLASEDAMGWTVRLVVGKSGDDPAIEATASDADALTAAYAATRLLLLRLGHAVADDSFVVATSLPVQELLSKIEAAVLSDNLSMAEQLLKQAPEELRQSPQVRLRVADIDERFGRYEAAHQQLEQLINDVTVEHDPILRGRILYRKGIVDLRRDKAELALRSFEAAAGLFEGRNVPAEMGKVVGGRGIAHAMQGQYDQAAEEFSKARIAYEMAGDMVSLAALESNEGALENLRHRPANALTLLDKAIRRMESLRTFNGLPQAYASKIKALLLLLAADDAVAVGKDFDTRFPEAPAVAARANLGILRAHALAASGRLLEAQTRLQQLQFDDSIRASESTQARIHAMLAQLRRMAGDPEAAVQLARDALRVLVLGDDSGERSRAWRELVRALLILGRDGEAAIEAQAFSDWAAPLSDSEAKVRALLSSAEVARASSDSVAAESAFKAALELALKEGVPAYIGQASVAYANALLDAGDIAAATSVASRALHWSDSDFDCAVLKVRLYQQLGETAVWRAALVQARVLGRERQIPPALLVAPVTADAPASR